MKRMLLAAALVLLVADLSYGQTCQAVINGAKARISIQQPKWADAREVLAESLEDCQDNAEYHYLYAIMLAKVSADSTAKAIEHLEIADSLNGEPTGTEGKEVELQANIDQAFMALWGPIVNEGVRLLQAGRVDEALEKLQFAARMNPGDKRGQLALGAAYQAKNDYEQAIAAYEKALEIDPAYRDALIRLAQAYQLKADAYAGSGDSAKVAQSTTIARQAVDIYEKYLAQNPGDPDVQVQLAGLYASLGELEKAEPIIRQVMESDSVSAQTMTDFGFRMANAQEYDLAEQLLTRAIALSDSMNVEPISYLVFVRIRKGDLQGARAMLQKQLELEPSNAEAWEYLGYAERDLGNTAAAQEAFRRAETIPLELENLRIGQDQDGTWNVEATFSNRTDKPVQDVTVRFSLISGTGEVLETKEATIASAQALAAGAAESVTVEFDKPADNPRVKYEIVT